MTEKEIKSSLLCCDFPTDELCCKCSFKGEEDCTGKLTQATIDLINRQQAEIEHLQGERDVMLEDLQFRTNQVIEQQAEIERLERELDIALENDPSKTYPYEVITPYGVVFSKCEKCYEDFKMDIKSEAIKEFAERLKKHSYFDQKDQRKVVAEVIIDHYIKEMTEPSLLDKKFGGEQK